MNDPQTPREWQNAVDAANGALALHSARLYGLVSGGPIVNVARCESILRDGSSRKIFPRHDSIKRFAAELMQLPTLPAQPANVIIRENSDKPRRKRIDTKGEDHGSV